MSKSVGLYRKFTVERTDGSSGPGGKHEACEYFVLDWAHDPFAVPAALAYADACEATHPTLAADLRVKADEHLPPPGQAAGDLDDPIGAEFAAERAGWNAYFDNPADLRQCKYRPGTEAHHTHSVAWDQAFDWARRCALVGLGRDCRGWLTTSAFDEALARLRAELDALASELERQKDEAKAARKAAKRGGP